MEVIYSRSRHPLCEGRHYVNPRHYSGPVEGAEKVLIDGEWPKISADYTALGVPVEKIGATAERKRRRSPPSQPDRDSE